MNEIPKVGYCLDVQPSDSKPSVGAVNVVLFVLAGMPLPLPLIFVLSNSPRKGPA